MLRALSLSLAGLSLLVVSAPAAAQQQAGGVACVLGDHEGVAPPDARSATSLVCDEIFRVGGAGQGFVSDPASASELYVVDILPLGRSVILRVSYESPAGTVRDSRNMTMSGLEEVPQAAPRLAQSIVNGTPIEDTATVDGLVQQETRVYQKKHGEYLWGIGILGTHVPTIDAPMGPGLAVSFYYETPEFAIGSEIRISGGPGEHDWFLFTSWSVGGRYLFLDGNWSPYVGGGLGFDTILFGKKGWDTDQDAAYGVGAYVEVGFELLRLHSTRLGVQVRADLPFFDANSNWFGQGGETRYLAPITLGVSFSW